MSISTRYPLTQTSSFTLLRSSLPTHQTHVSQLPTLLPLQHTYFDTKASHPLKTSDPASLDVSLSANNIIENDGELKDDNLYGCKKYMRGRCAEVNKLGLSDY
ncbi:hypothetical protein MTR_5g038775 [Medicago truncatula]|uniref:Uncharacterized protein n=1 Tax=Medicago truncatula TaxID=3880 RepID=Q2HTX2_MEDTR|nr:hypothetical protein MtrDRAFT_AC149601g5v2 [Medicago truncatula]KEH27804.1 hypothetical protein MTR_5g038775 [Medicago truncatula]